MKFKTLVHERLLWHRWGSLWGLLGLSLGLMGAVEDPVLVPKQGLPPFRYQPSPVPLPNYTPNARWGTQGEPIQTMQAPLSPEESSQHLVLLPGFESQLFAAEPDIVNPLWLAWDERGRLWIAESIDYPNELQPEGEGRDRITICEDTDGDGRADRFIVFADRLSIPTSFVFYHGGIIVIHSGKTEFMRDNDGDDRMDERRVLFEGWGTRDTHATASNLRYGFDNWIWGVVGYSGFDGNVGGKDVRFGQGIFRFKPDGSALEFIRSSNNNTWGLGITEDNMIIGSTANGNASMYMPIPNRYYEGVRGWSASRLESITTNQNFYPITDRVRQVDWHGKYTAGSGSAIYTARQFPQAFWNRAQFVAEPTGHLLGLFFLDRNGADFTARNAKNFLASDDEWTAPIYGEVGPDGSLWMADWYNYIIQHNPTPIGFETGKGNAYETPLRDKKHARIYRVQWKNAKEGSVKGIWGASPTQWVKTLRSDNLLWRSLAQQRLVSGQHREVLGALRDLIENPKRDELGLDPGALHALWVMEGLGMMGAEGRELGEKALTHLSASVRRGAVMVLPKDARTRDQLLQGKLLEDSDAQVRLAVLLAFSELSSSHEVGAAIVSALEKSENSNDRWILDGATAAGAAHAEGFLNSILARKADKSLGKEVRQVIQRVAHHYAADTPSQSIVSVLSSLKGASDGAVEVVLEGLISGWPKGQAPDICAADRARLEELMDSLPETFRDRLLALGQIWGQPEFFGANVGEIVQALSSQIQEANLVEAARINAARRLVRIKDSVESANLILDQISLLTVPDLARGLVNSLTSSEVPGTGEAILSHWNRFTPGVRRGVIQVLMRRPEWTLALLDSIQNNGIARTDLGPEHWSQLQQNPDRRIARRAGQIFASGTSISSDREAVVSALLPLASEKGNAERGKDVFSMNCAVCHILDGQGGRVGPELTGISSRDRKDILLEVLDPNRSVEANYRLWNLSTKNQEAYSGRLEAETQTTLEILDIAGQKHVIQRENIASIEVSSLSIMPVGFENLPKEDLRDLIEFLATPHHQ